MTILQVSRMFSATAVSATTQSSHTQSKAHTDRNQAQTAASLPASAAEALSGCAENVCSASVTGPAGRTAAIGFIKDAATIVQHGRHVVILVLQDLYNLFTLSQEQMQLQRQQAVTNQPLTRQQPHKSQQKHGVITKGSKAILRKLHFLLAWANELSDTIYADMTQAALDEWQQHASTLNEAKCSNQLDIDPFIQATLTNKVESRNSKRIQEF